MTDIRLLLADDQQIIREGIRSLLSDYEDITVIGEAENGRELLRIAHDLKPDIILTDIRMPFMDGVEAVRLLKQQLPGIIVIVLTTFDDDEYIIEAMTGGAAGYLLKDISGSQLAQALRDALRGSLILPGRIAAKITSHLSAAGRADRPANSGLSDNNTGSKNTVGAVRPDYQDDYGFSSREQNIIQLLIKGQTNREIADSLFLTVGTVKNYISQIYLKLGVNDRANAVILLKELQDRKI